MRGRPVRELVGKTMKDLFPSELAKSMVQDNLRILREGKPPLLAGFTMDVTERKQAEEALRKEKGVAQKYLDIAGVILLVINTDEDITLINRRNCKILGYKEEEIIGKNWINARFKPLNVDLQVSLQ